MKNEEIQFIKRCIETPMTFQYSEGTFAKLLLSYLSEDRQKISEIKASKIGYLLHKPSVKAVVAKCGNGLLKKELLQEEWTEKTKILSLSLSQWGIQDTKKKNCAYYQVSRPQKSLVLQVNFGGDHDTFFYSCFSKKQRVYFSNEMHAGHFKRNSLGWIRIDLDLETGEALIEEVQTDWMKTVFSLRNELKLDNSDHALIMKRPNACKSYVNYMLQRYKAWDEMLLSSAIRFLKQEIGINTIWYHTFESGRFYKMMPDYSLPPRSLYTTLPKKMGFEITNQIPKILKECKELKRMNNAAKGINFFRLNFKK